MTADDAQRTVKRKRWTQDDRDGGRAGAPWRGPSLCSLGATLLAYRTRRAVAAQDRSPESSQVCTDVRSGLR